MKNPDTCNDATSLFCDCFLMLHSHTSPEVSAQFYEILSSNQPLFQVLITSSSKRIQYNALRLTHSLLINHCEELAKPLLLSCMDIFFASPRCNVIHYIICQIIQSIFKNTSPEFPQLLLEKGHLTERILTAYKSPQSGNEYYGHMVNIAKWITESPYCRIDETLQTQQWVSWYQNYVEKTFSKPCLLPPTIELRDQNRKSQKTTLPNGEAI